MRQIFTIIIVVAFTANAAAADEYLIVTKTAEVYKGKFVKIEEGDLKFVPAPYSLPYQDKRIPVSQVRIIINEQNQIIYPPQPKQHLSALSDRQLQIELTKLQLSETENMRKELRGIRHATTAIAIISGAVVVAAIAAVVNLSDQN